MNQMMKEMWKEINLVNFFKPNLTMKNIGSLVIVILLYSFLIDTSYSQQSRFEIAKSRALKKNNNVKTITVTGNGYTAVTQVDTEGKVINSITYKNEVKENSKIYKYDSFGRVIEINNNDGFIEYYEYDDEGNVKSISTINAKGLSTLDQFFKYDEKGHVVYELRDQKVIDPFEKVSENKYDEDKLISTQFKCGSNEWVSYIKYSYENNLLSTIESFRKNCFNDSLKIETITSFSRFDNSLTQQAIYHNIDPERTYIWDYAYEFYDR